jgi:hypothetical protein
MAILAHAQLDDPEGPRRHALTLEEAEHRPAAGNGMLYDWRQDRRVTPSDHAERQPGRDRPLSASRDNSHPDRRFDSSRRGGRGFARPFARDQDHDMDHDRGRERERDRGQRSEPGHDEDPTRPPRWRDPAARDAEGTSPSGPGTRWRAADEDSRPDGHASRSPALGTPPKVTSIAQAPTETTSAALSANEASPGRAGEGFDADRSQTLGRPTNHDERHSDASPSSSPRRPGRAQEVRVRVGGSRSRLAANTSRMAPVVRLPGASRIRSDANANTAAVAVTATSSTAGAVENEGTNESTSSQPASTPLPAQESSSGAAAASSAAAAVAAATPKVIVHDHRTKRNTPRPARVAAPTRPTFSSVAKLAPAPVTPAASAVKPSSLSVAAAKTNTGKSSPAAAASGGGGSTAPPPAVATAATTTRKRATALPTSSQTRSAAKPAAPSGGTQRADTFSRLSVADESDWSSDSDDERPSSPPVRPGLVVVPIQADPSTATAPAGEDDEGEAEEFVEVLSRQKLKERRQQEEERQKQAEKAERARQERQKKKEVAKQLENEKKRFLQEHMEQRERERKEQEERFRQREEARKQEEQRRAEQEAQEKAERERREREAQEQVEQLAKQKEDAARRQEQERLKREDEDRTAEQKRREETLRLAEAASLAGKSYLPTVNDKILLKEEAPWAKHVRDSGLVPPEVEGRPSSLMLDDERNIIAVSRRLWSTDDQSG